MLFEALDFIADREPRAAALNMAIDEALLGAASAPLLRIYRWRSPSVSMGYFEKSAPVLSAHPGREAVRRWTGGGVVLHGIDLTYSLIVPAGFFAWKNAAGSYAAIHACVAAWLRGAGLEVALASGATACVSRDCFANPVAHDLLLDGGKIGGAAQRRTRSGLLHQGSLLVPGQPDPAGLAAALALRVRLSVIAPALLESAHRIALERYASSDWLHLR